MKIVVVPSGCWEWRGARNSAGYGTVNLQGKSHFLHRLMYTVYYGAIPPKMFVMHSCDNKKCCNPKHLSVGSHAENMQDMVRKGRSGLGAKNSMARLTEAQVVAIRAAKAAAKGAPHWGNGRFAKKYGVNHATISLAASGKNWRGLRGK